MTTYFVSLYLTTKFFTIQQSLELERYQREIGYERANQLSALAPNASTCNLERNLAAEKEEAEQRGLLPAAVTHPRVPLPDNG